MPFGWELAPRTYGVIVISAGGEVIVLEFNEFLARIASEAIQPDDEVISRVFTDGRRRRVGDLRVYALIRSGRLPTADLPRYASNGVLATGEEARAYLSALEKKTHVPDVDFTTLLRATLQPLGAELSHELLRSVISNPQVPPSELPHPAMPPTPRDKL